MAPVRSSVATTASVGAASLFAGVSGGFSLGE
jgi:hypothetical protein